jgi:hypothetical protein
MMAIRITAAAVALAVLMLAVELLHGHSLF